MSNLSSLNINQSYQGLLNLSDSTTGITSTPQQIQDGLGNDTGIKIGTNRLEGGNIVNIYRLGAPQYLGLGFSTTAINPGSVQNQLNCSLFYDSGIYSYSAITLNCLTLEAGTSVDVAFYNTQYLDTYGVAPYQKLAEVNIITTSTGLKTATFASPLSFSGTGGGLYWLVLRYNTAGTPVLRLANSLGTNTAFYTAWLGQSNLGLVYNTAGTAALTPYRVNSTSTSTIGMVLNTASFPSTMTTTELNTLTTTTATQAGFLFHTIR